MLYPDYENLNKSLNELKEYGGLKCEYGCDAEVNEIVGRLTLEAAQALEKIKKLQDDPNMAKKEPDTLDEIRSLRAVGGKNLSAPTVVNPDCLKDKLWGAILGRFAGCTLGVPVENWSIGDMKALADATGTPFPPTEYWHDVTDSFRLQYGKSPRSAYTKGKMDGVPVDDDITYTLLDLLILEEYGFDFTTENVGEAWKKYLPCACTAEKAALDNLNNGINALNAAEVDNPYCQLIGADIRSDGWAFAAAGNPELAAKLAYRDAYLSHRRNGIYGEMFFAAAQAAAFTAENAEHALRAGLAEIPYECSLYSDIVWALEKSKDIHNYSEARAAVDARFPGMHRVHTNNNACLTVFGLILGKGDFTKTISELVAMGLDNDCTAATAGAIAGAIAGKRGIDTAWYESFNDKVYTYMKGVPELSLSDVVDRFYRLATSKKG